MCIRDSLWIARRLTEPDGQFVAATFEKWNYTAYYWLPDPTNKLDWQDGARFYVRVMQRSTWATFLEQISSFIRFEMFTWIETEPQFESNLSKHTTQFTLSN